jgi:hypothetical protein
LAALGFWIIVPGVLLISYLRISAERGRITNESKEIHEARQKREEAESEAARRQWENATDAQKQGLQREAERKRMEDFARQLREQSLRDAKRRR